MRDLIPHNKSGPVLSRERLCYAMSQRPVPLEPRDWPVQLYAPTQSLLSKAAGPWQTHDKLCQSLPITAPRNADTSSTRIHGPTELGPWRSCRQFFFLSFPVADVFVDKGAPLHAFEHHMKLFVDRAPVTWALRWSAKDACEPHLGFRNVLLRPGQCRGLRLGEAATASLFARGLLQLLSGVSEVKVGGLGSLTWATVIALIVHVPASCRCKRKGARGLPEAGKTLGIVFFSLSAHCMGFLLPVGAGCRRWGVRVFSVRRCGEFPYCIGLTVVDLFAMSALGGAAGSEHSAEFAASASASLRSGRAHRRTLRLQRGPTRRAGTT